LGSVFYEAFFSGRKIILDISVNIDIGQTHSDMTIGHILTAVHDRWRLLPVRICAGDLDIPQRQFARRKIKQ
jgi:hypothetical protein